MAKDHDKSLGDQPSITGTGGGEDHDPQSLGDQATFAGGALDADSQSLGDQSTMGGGGGTDSDMSFGDGMEIVDLSARYTTEGVLGKGGMGEVLLASDTLLGRKVAIKRMLGEAANSRTAVNRFLTEAKSIAALSNHPNIVDIYDFGRAADGPFLIMEYIDGGSLLDKCRKGAIPLEEAVELTCQLCSALDKAHAADIIHRDIKPANVLMSEDGIPILTDFGLAKDEAADTGQTMAGAVLGTLDFMPPEQRRDAALTDARSDLWSLAATLYQMVTGKSPKIIRFNDVPQSIQDVLGKALEEDKDDRYQTARELRDALRGCLTATEPVPEVAVDLGTGECPQCHTKNEASRKFCRECAAALRVECLKCSEEIPVWDKICGECGGNQKALVTARHEELHSQRSETEQHRDAYAYQSALVIARGIAAVEDDRFLEHNGWAEEFITSTESEWERETTSAREHFEEARTHRDAFDYQAAIHTLEQIPEGMRTSDMADYLSQVQQEQEESVHLVQTIADRVKQRDLSGLLAQVDRACELRGDREDLQKLQRQLREREQKTLLSQRDKAYGEAAFLLESGEVKQALEKIDSLSEKIPLRPSDRELKKRLLEIVPSKIVIKNSIGMQLKLLPAGTFGMGKERFLRRLLRSNGRPQVTLTQPFYMGVYQVVQSHYEQVMGTNPSEFKEPDKPVECVNWEDAVEFCRRLSALPEEQSEGRVYRLPTEAEWEYACRAGTTIRYSFGDDATQLGEYAWFRDNAGDSTHPVGQKLPNAWGLYDMQGNVWEWCQDWDAGYPKGNVTDPTGASSGSLRVIRGGSGASDARDCESAHRISYAPDDRSNDLGFRVALSLPAAGGAR